MSDTPKVPFRPTHEHAAGGLYEMLGHGKAKLEGDWENAVFYRNAEGALFATTTLRWNARFVPVQSGLDSSYRISALSLEDLPLKAIEPGAVLRMDKGLVDHLRIALVEIALLHPAVDSEEGDNKRGEAACFRRAQRIATNALNAAPSTKAPE